MATFLPSINEKIKAFIEKQHIFFVATALAEGSVNLSPKGMDTLRVTGPNQVKWLNLTGSGNETAIHLQQNPRMTLMFCSFEKNPMILRLYGQAKCHHKGEPDYEKDIALFPSWNGSRQIIEVSVDRVQTSCGFAVPFMEYKGERDTLNLGMAKKEASGIHHYWNDRNHQSIDGFPSDVFKKDAL